MRVRPVPLDRRRCAAADDLDTSNGRREVNAMLRCDPANGDGHYFVKSNVDPTVWVCCKDGCGATQSR
ncbi:predicted protein [Streptomyces sp. AA4]|nr:predicted protein [Streptomyces sp. AA4]